MSEIYLLAAVLASLPCLICGPWVASHKGRSRLEGFLLAMFFGPIGLLIEAMLPIKNPRKYQMPFAKPYVVAEYSDDWDKSLHAEPTAVDEWLKS